MDLEYEFNSDFELSLYNVFMVNMIEKMSFQELTGATKGLFETEKVFFGMLLM